MYFRAQNEYAGIDISDADFVLVDDQEQPVDQPLPPAVVQAIDVLRAYASTLEMV